MRLAAALENEANALEGQVSAAAAACRRCGSRIAELDRMLQELQSELTQLRRRRAELSEDLERRAGMLTAAKEQLDQLHQQCAAAQTALAELRQRQSGVVERAAVLHELIQRHEGLSAGVKEVLTRAGNPADPVFRETCGLVADVFHVSLEVAPLVEIALGQAAQHVVAPCLGADEAFDRRGRSSQRPRGIRVARTRRPTTLRRAPLSSRAEPRRPARRLGPRRPVCGDASAIRRLGPPAARADVVRGAACPCDRAGPSGGPRIDLRHALRRVVGARRHAHGRPAHGRQWTDLAPQPVAPLLAERDQLAAAIAETEQTVGQIERQVDAQQELVAQRAAEQQQVADAVADNRVAVSASEERRSQLDRQRAQLDGESQAAAAQHATAVSQLAATQQKRRELDAGVNDMESLLARLAEQIDRLEQRRLAYSRESTEIKVESAKCEEHLRNLRARLRQFEETRQERDRAIVEARQQMAECDRRADASRWSILQAESEIAELYLAVETVAAQIVGLINERESLQEQRTRLVSEIQKVHARARKLEERLHAVELSANEVRHDRGNLADRMREDYHVELAELDHEPSDQEQRERESVQQEIEELRHKLNNLGNVNLESLEELEQLETRHQSLSNQYQDLVAAKGSLEKIIDKINTDSRRLFSEVLNTVKGHFQNLFRDLFGGGQADIILEENVDILDSGIEIVARPPGKEPRSISLLSGGEKTLTCVVLLLAIFRSRPSPFCVLDEVDAALDEANIDRFTQVLQGFLAWTQFIIITHSKKTMTCEHDLRRDDAGVGRVEAGFRAL